MLVANGTCYARALAHPSPFVILRINELYHSLKLKRAGYVLVFSSDFHLYSGPPLQSNLLLSPILDLEVW